MGRFLLEWMSRMPLLPWQSFWRSRLCLQGFLMHLATFASFTKHCMALSKLHKHGPPSLVIWFFFALVSLKVVTSTLSKSLLVSFVLLLLCIDDTIITGDEAIPAPPKNIWISSLEWWILELVGIFCDLRSLIVPADLFCLSKSILLTLLIVLLFFISRMWLLFWN